ncbi:Uridine kinase-like protein 2, chloroplastic [Glycine max]|nr:Uridine kinase-like protein 2, chloroplastic [Glycine max]
MIIQQLHDHRVVLVNQDSFYHGLNPEELEHAFDTEQLLECTRKLISGQGVHVPIYDFKKHQCSF